MNKREYILKGLNKWNQRHITKIFTK
jgi:hypothetical protein